MGLFLTSSYIYAKSIIYIVLGFNIIWQRLRTDKSHTEPLGAIICYKNITVSDTQRTGWLSPHKNELFQVLSHNMIFKSYQLPIPEKNTL